MDSLSSLCKTKVNVRSPVWSPIMKCDYQCSERVQRRFTKRPGNLCDTSLNERLISPNALALEHERTVFDCTDVVYGKVDYCLEDTGIKLAANNKRRGKFCLTQHHRARRILNALFQNRAVCDWYALPERITKSSSFGQFEKLLRAHL